jgi:phosphoglycerol transferase MdoB-like AlkP superfamily enzyme
MTKEKMQTEAAAGGKKFIKFLFLIWRITGGIGIIAMPVISFVLFETVTGNLPYIEPFYVKLNIMWYFALYLLLFGISGTTRIAVPLASGFFYALSLAETFVMLYRGSPIMPADIAAIGTASTVMGQYKLELSDTMQKAGAILIVLNILLLTAPIHVKNLKQRLAGAVGGIGGAVAIGLVFYLHFLPHYHMQINQWELPVTFEKNGYVVTSAVAMQYVAIKPPRDYSQKRLDQLYEQITSEMKAQDNASGASGPDTAGAEITQPVNIICIMNESLSDLQVAGDFETNEDYFPYLRSLADSTIHGNLCVPVFGSGTSNSEFEFLTGDSMGLMPVGTTAYQFYVKPEAKTLVSTLKDQGYQTVAMHPYPGTNWNRDVCYDNMGFDAFYYGDYYDNLETMRTYITDRADYQKIIELVEDKKQPDDSLFIFNVTMQNHGGYEIDEPALRERADIHLTGELEGRYPMVDQFLSLMKLSDEALEELLGYFENSDQPTMIVMFGDHQPSVEDAFWDEIAGMPSDEVPAPEHLMWYKTPFFIWTNYAHQSEDMGDLSSIFLASKMLDTAGLSMTPYQYFLLQMSKQLPVVHKIGYFDKENVWYEWSAASSADCPYARLVLDYETMAFNHSLDRKKDVKLFMLPVTEEKLENAPE